MVLKKINYGFNGFHVPIVPKAPRSARKKGPLRKTIDDGQMCAFELLASLAGKLLQESEISSASSNASEGNGLHLDKNACNKQEQKNDEAKSLIADGVNHVSYKESAFVSKLGLPNRDVKFSSNGLTYDECDSTLACASISNNSGSSMKLGGDIKSPVCKLEASSGDSHGTENMVLCSESPVLVNSGCKVELPTCTVPVLDASFTRHKNGVKLGIRDDDEKFLRGAKSSTSMKYFRPMSRVGGRRIRKLLTSKYWKVAPKLTDYDIPRTDGRIKPFQYHKRKFCQSRERYQYNSVYKRRKYFDQNSVVISDGGFSSESVSYLPEKAMKGYKTGVNGVCCATMGPQTTFNSRDSHVQFSIRSFRVPELVIEVPETSTVRSLKKTVSEAVTAMLKGHLRVGVLLQGKKIRDDNRTLSQTGITCKENLESLGFTLEPDIMQASTPLCSDEPPVSLTCDTSLLISRSPGDFISDAGKSDTTIQLSNPPLLMNSNNNDEVNNETATTLHTNTSTDTTIDYSRALVPVPAIIINALAIVPANQKPRRTEFVQRRIRRPFSVTEVEALVHAVEELGTGRWRDVKIRCFENADHRTYVDLKDKWKTLVHTAKIAPQQRRGEPVPQELLDRVLAAHGYWSEHQIRQHGKHQPGNPKITEAAHAD